MAWIQSFANQGDSAHQAEWAEAWFALDALMHKTCHIASSVNFIQDSQSDVQLSDLLKPIIEAHHRWQQRLIVYQAKEFERTGELVSQHLASPNLESLPIIYSPLSISEKEATRIRFLNHPPIIITDRFFAARLNNWRALGLYISLIQQPLWGKSNDNVIVDALNLCRTYAALGSENNFLDAEKAIGLYLAGVVFSGPEMYSVIFFDAVLIEERIGVDSRAVARRYSFEPNCFNSVQQFTPDVESQRKLLDYNSVMPGQLILYTLC